MKAACGHEFKYGDNPLSTLLLMKEEIAKENGKLEKYGAKPVSGLDRIRHSFAAAMADTDTRLLTQMNAKKSNATQVAIVTAETAEKVETKEGDIK